jgi:hypothetical protein
MKRTHGAGRHFAMVALTLLVGLAVSQSTAVSSRSGTRQRARITNVGVITTHDFRVAVVARRLAGGSTPTAEVRVGLARRVQATWRELPERKLGETYFWNTVSGAHAICRLEIESVGARHRPASQVTVQLLLSPSVGCASVYRIPLPTR